MAGQPILPNKPHSPAMTTTIVNRANVNIRKAMRQIQKATLDLFEGIPRERVSADQGGIANNAESIYKYMISEQAIGQIPGELGRIIDLYLLENNRVDWWGYKEIAAGGAVGASAEVVNIMAQTTPAEYPTTVQSAVMSDAHRARVELVKGRMFEEMQNLNATMRANLSRILTDGMAGGLSPRDIANQIHTEIGLPKWNDGKSGASYARAKMIAETEINKAARDTRQGQRDDARRIGVGGKTVWLSALRPTTRRTHARRHGNYYTEQENNQFYSRDGNAIHCRCSQIFVVVDKDGNPRDPKFRERLEKQKKRYEEKEGLQE